MSAKGVVQTLSANGQTNGVGTVGKVRAVITGTFGGGTASLETRDPDGNWLSPYTGLTIDGEIIIDAPEHCQNEVRVDLAGATAPTVNVWIQSSLDR